MDANAVSDQLRGYQGGGIDLGLVRRVADDTPLVEDAAFPWLGVCRNETFCGHMLWTRRSSDTTDGSSELEKPFIPTDS
jgi:hypothetical protein